MNFDSLISWATGLAIAAAMAGHLGDLEVIVWKAEAKTLYESRSSKWGSFHFPANYHVLPAKRKN